MKRMILAGMMVFAAAAAQADDKAEMDAAWTKLMGFAEGETARLLQAEQDAWLKFQAAACGFYADKAAFGDEVQAEEQPKCQARTIAARTKELKAYLRVMDP